MKTKLAVLLTSLSVPVLLASFVLVAITTIAVTGCRGNTSAIGAQNETQFQYTQLGVQDYLYSSDSAGISVTGMAETEVEPNIAILNLAAEHKAQSVREASDSIAQAVSAMTRALEDLGIGMDDISTANISITAQQRRLTDELVPDGYHARQSVTVTVRNLDNVSEALQVALTAGGDTSRLYGVNFQFDDMGSLQSSLRRDAALEAREIAQTYADALGVTLGPVVYIREQSFPQFARRTEAFFDGSEAFSSSSPAFDIRPSDISVSLIVEARFAILN